MEILRVEAYVSIFTTSVHHLATLFLFILDTSNVSWKSKCIQFVFRNMLCNVHSTTSGILWREHDKSTQVSYWQLKLSLLQVGSVHILGIGMVVHQKLHICGGNLCEKLTYNLQ